MLRIYYCARKYEGITIKWYTKKTFNQIVQRATIKKKVKFKNIKSIQFKGIYSIYFPKLL